MKNNSLVLSSKYQVVIPRSARKKMGLENGQGQRFRVAKVTENTIVFEKEPSVEDFLGAYSDSFAPDSTALLRKQRDEEWK